MEAYHNIGYSPFATPAPGSPVKTPSFPADDENKVDDFDLHRWLLLSQSISNEGWQAELRRYLTDILQDVSKETDIVEWWSVSGSR
jgi:hypothetical protein